MKRNGENVPQALQRGWGWWFLTAAYGGGVLVAVWAGHLLVEANELTTTGTALLLGLAATLVYLVVRMFIEGPREEGLRYVDVFTIKTVPWSEVLDVFFDERGAICLEIAPDVFQSVSPLQYRHPDLLHAWLLDVTKNRRHQRPKPR